MAANGLLRYTMGAAFPFFTVQIDVRSSWCEMGYVAASIYLHAYGTDSLDLLQIRTGHPQEECL